jgi:hypothetical protein
LDHLDLSKTPQNQQKGKRGREPTIIIAFFHIMTIVGEGLQTISKNGETFSSRRGIYFSDVQKMTKVIKRKQKLEKVRGRQNFCCYI